MELDSLGRRFAWQLQPLDFLYMLSSSISNTSTSVLFLEQP